MSENIVSNIETAWDAETYDSPRRQLVPSFDRLYDSLGALIANLGIRQPRILDLGAGTGLASAAVVRAVPGAHVHLVDASAEMLAKASARLGPLAETTVSDLMNPLPAGPFDAVISALAIHHLDDAAKQDLFHRIHDVLAPSGIFANVEQVLAPTPELDDLYSEQHERYARERGSDDAEWSAALERMLLDRPATVDAQLDWLRAAGFTPVDVLVKDWRFALYAGWVTTSTDRRATGSAPSVRTEP